MIAPFSSLAIYDWQDVSLEWFHLPWSSSCYEQWVSNKALLKAVYPCFFHQRVSDMSFSLTGSLVIFHLIANSMWVITYLLSTLITSNPITNNRMWVTGYHSIWQLASLFCHNGQYVSGTFLQRCNHMSHYSHPMTNRLWVIIYFICQDIHFPPHELQYVSDASGAFPLVDLTLWLSGCKLHYICPIQVLCHAINSLWVLWHSCLARC